MGDGSTCSYHLFVVEMLMAIISYYCVYHIALLYSIGIPQTERATFFPGWYGLQMISVSEFLKVATGTSWKLFEEDVPTYQERDVENTDNQTLLHPPNPRKIRTQCAKVATVPPSMGAATVILSLFSSPFPD